MKRFPILSLALVTLAAVGIVGWVALRPSSSSSSDRDVISELVSSEERILELSPQLRSLAAGLLNLELPDASGLDYFAPLVDITDLEGGAPDALVAGQTSAVTRDSLALWSPLLGAIDWFEYASFYFVDGEFRDDDFEIFEGQVGFKGLAKMRAGDWRGIEAKQIVSWRKDGEDWKIIGWKMKDLHGTASPRRLFEESLVEALPRRADYLKARRSVHQEAAIAYYRSQKKELPHRYFAPISANQKPGISVVDIEGDGDDDIYVTVRMGENLLLENQGDGTFLETAAQRGINFNGHGTCALFADFDNDGDPDLLLGRSLRPSIYFENQAGHFHAIEQEGGLSMLVVSMSAADYNGDGLLDFYLCTYRPATIKDSASPSGGVSGELTTWPEQFFEPEMAEEYHRRYEEANRDADPQFPNLLNQIGPKNFLYANRGGGKFEVAAESEELGVWRNSLQATWSDFDDDGDPDVYIANDWARGLLFRNDGDDGLHRRYRDRLGRPSSGSRMGASFGDYDNDGLQDLYVSNMFSKAGQRIYRDGSPASSTRRISNRPRGQLPLPARGTVGSFELVSGLEKPNLQVANGRLGVGVGSSRISTMTGSSTSTR